MPYVDEFKTTAVLADGDILMAKACLAAEVPADAAGDLRLADSTVPELEAEATEQLEHAACELPE